jgi:hypothetical protein
MKNTILPVLIALMVYAVPASAQDFYTGTEHTPKNATFVRQCQRDQEVLLMKLNATMAVLRDRLAHDQAFHFGRLPSTREKTIYNDNICIQNQQQAIDHTRDLLNEYDAWLKTYK